ncbi:hypothetical protein ACFHW2_31285 [Actinomadura sp. LOL_016]|uniref:hypothetical protein n=1 Tax=unclassified Actinomadura TaxID=2626254 RepID=UPI003A804951
MESGYFLAGYRVATRPDRQDWQDTSLPATDLVSLSDCVVDLIPTKPDGWDDWFGTVHEAEAARKQAAEPGFHVLAVGIATADVPEVLTDVADSGWRTAADSFPEFLARRETFPHDGGLRLGFEPVGFGHGWHTWTCLGGLVGDVRRATGVRPGRWGLIQDERDARRAARRLTDSGLGDPKVFFWTAALLADLTAAV